MRNIHWHRTMVWMLLFGLLVPALAACGGTATTPAATTPAANTGTAAPGVLRMNLGNEPDNIDPQKASFAAEIAFIMMAYQGLMTFDKDLKPIPGAAESVTTSADGLKYTFTLRPDSKYADGSPLTAKDFAYAWRRLASPETAGQYQALPCGIIKGYSEWSAAACQGLTLTDTLALDLKTLEAGYGVKALDARTLEIELTTPAPYFLSIAALWVGVPVRAADVVKADDWWYTAANYVGNGPFRLKTWDHGSKAVWEANPNYNGPLGPVKLKRVEYYMITETQVAFQAYQNGDLDGLTVAPEDLATIQTDPGLSKQTVAVPGQCSYYFGFNLKYPPFDNIKVRQAFALAIDREAWVRDIWSGLGSVSYSFIPPGVPGYQPDLKAFTFDAAAAKARLAEAGYPDGKGLPEIKLSYAASTRNNARFEWLAGQLKTNLGVMVALDPVETTAYTALVKAGKVPFFSLSWCMDYPDPQNWVSLWQTNGLLAPRYNYTNPKLDALVKQADIEQNATKRLALYNEAQTILINDVVFVPNLVNSGLVLVKPYVQGITAKTVTPLDHWWGFFNLPNVDVQL